MLQVTWLVLTNQSAIISAFEHYSNFFMAFSPGQNGRKINLWKTKQEWKVIIMDYDTFVEINFSVTKRLLCSLFL